MCLQIATVDYLLHALLHELAEDFAVFLWVANQALEPSVARLITAWDSEI